MCQLHCRLCPPSHATPLHMLSLVTERSVPGGVVAVSAWCLLNVHKIVLESQGAFVNTTFERYRRHQSVLRSDTVRVDLKPVKILPIHRGRLLHTRKGRIPDHCASSRKFQGHGRMCLCGCAKISRSFLDSGHSLILARTALDLERKKKVTSNRQFFVSATRIS